MGSSSSKVTRGVTRKYPAAPSTGATATRLPLKTGAGAPSSSRSASKQGITDDAIHFDMKDSDADAVTGAFSQRLQQMGVVQPNPTYSPSSIADTQSPVGIPNQTIAAPNFPPKKANSTLSALEARRLLQHQAERDFEALGSRNSKGRRLVDMRTLIDGLQLLNRGVSQADVEKRLQLEAGLLSRLGGPRIISHETTKSTT